MSWNHNEITRHGQEMNGSWLIQRLDVPHAGFGALGKDNPFAFGGGFKNGGLGPEAMELLRNIFTFDYMGAAEFEFGAVPTALQYIAILVDEYEAFSFEVNLQDVEQGWGAKRKAKAKPTGTGTVYLLARHDDMPEVERRVRGWATAYYNTDLKETTFLASALTPVEEWDSRHAGWLELDNGFMFFTSEEMWRATCDLFGVQTKAATPS